MFEKFGAGHVVGFAPPGDQPGLGALAAQARVRWAHEDFSWQNMEPSPGTYRFSTHDTIVNNAVANGLRVFVNLAYTPQFYSSNPGAPNFLVYPTTSPAGLQAWSSFVTATVNHFKDRVKHWQIWPNIDDHAVWAPDPGVGEYLALLQRAHAAIKAADPTAVVVTASMDPVFLNQLLDAGGAPYFDAIGVHNYANPYTPEVSRLVELRLASLRDVSRRRAGGKPLWVSEGGWPSAPGSSIGVTEETQAAFLIRSMLLQGTQPDVPVITWTDFYDFPVGGVWTPDDAADNYGMLLKVNYAPKLAFNAYRAMTAALQGTRFLRQQVRPGAPLHTEDFEAPRTYQVQTAAGATGSYSRFVGMGATGIGSGQINYNLTTTVGSVVVITPNPIPTLPGAPNRISLAVRGSGATAPQIGVRFEDATGERFEATMGLALAGWSRFTFPLDAPAPAPDRLTNFGGNANRIVDYPIRFTGIAVRFWPLGSTVTSGTVWVDDLRFESGATVYEQVHTTAAGAATHALWTVNAPGGVTVATRAASGTLRNWTGGVTTLPASNGQVTVPVDTHPVFVSFPPLPNPATTGVFRPSNGALFLKNRNVSGFADVALTYGIPGDRPVVGDWDGDGIVTIGIFRNGVFYLRNSNTNGVAELVVPYGLSGDFPVAGDWNGDGVDTIGVFRGGTFLLRNSNTSGPPELVFGLGGPGDLPMAGDWNGDGTVTTGVFRPSNGTLYLKNSNSSGFADLQLSYGLPGDFPVTGDWNGDGIDTIGVFRRGQFLLRNSNTNGFADISFFLGIDGDFPIAGDWDGLP